MIKDNYLINIGNSYIVCIYGTDDLVQMDNASSDISDKVLNIKIFSGNGNNEQSSFNPNTKGKICIGRDPECDIVIDDSLLSRVHCTIIYKDNVGWVLRDGRYVDEEKGGLYAMQRTLALVYVAGEWLFLPAQIDGAVVNLCGLCFGCCWPGLLSACLVLE